MNCCGANATGEFFDKQAHRMERYFRKKGLRREQKHLVDGIRQSGIENADLLEIGCGVGALHLSLLQAGARKAVGIDMSEKMIATARQLARKMDLDDRASYLQGDFVNVHDRVSLADVAILDKVICCYEQVQELIAHSARKARLLFAVVYPRHGWLAQGCFRLMVAVANLLRWKFHPYYHEPALIQRAITAAGFEKSFEQQTLIWVIQVFKRRNVNGEEAS